MNMKITEIDSLVEDVVKDVSSAHSLAGNIEPPPKEEHDDTLDELMGNWKKANERTGAEKRVEYPNQGDLILKNSKPFTKKVDLIDAVLRRVVSGAYIFNPLIELFGMEKEEAEHICWDLDNHRETFEFRGFGVCGHERTSQAVQFFSRMIETYKQAHKLNPKMQTSPYETDLEKISHNLLVSMCQERTQMEKLEMKQAEEKVRRGCGRRMR